MNTPSVVVVSTWSQLSAALVRKLIKKNIDVFVFSTDEKWDQCIGVKRVSDVADIPTDALHALIAFEQNPPSGLSASKVLYIYPHTRWDEHTPPPHENVGDIKALFLVNFWELIMDLLISYFSALTASGPSCYPIQILLCMY